MFRHANAHWGRCARARFPSISNQSLPCFRFPFPPVAVRQGAGPWVKSTPKVVPTISYHQLVTEFPHDFSSYHQLPATCMDEQWEWGLHPRNFKIDAPNKMPIFKDEVTFSKTIILVYLVRKTNISMAHLRWSPYSQTAPLSWSWDLTNVGPTKSLTTLAGFSLRVAMLSPGKIVFWKTILSYCIGPIRTPVMRLEWTELNCSWGLRLNQANCEGVFGSVLVEGKPGYNMHIYNI